MTALLIIGMQVDLLPGGPAEVPDSQPLVGILNRIIPNYDLVVAANFNLPADHVMFAANHLWRRPGQTIPIHGHPTLLHNIHCVPGSFGAEFIPGLKTEKITFTAMMGFDKDLPPYCAFFDFDKKRDTGLQHFFQQNLVNEVHLAGMPAEGEIANTALACRAMGLKTTLLVDACRGRLQAAVDAQLQAATMSGANLAFIASA